MSFAAFRSKSISNPLTYTHATVYDKIANLVDEFSFLDPNKWQTFGDVETQSDRLRLITLSGYSGVQSVSRWDLTESSLYARMYPATVGNGSREESILLYDGIDTGVHFIWAEGTLVMRVKRGGVNDDGYIEYNATDHAWWRIRETAGTVYFEAAPDVSGNPGSWTVLRSVVHAINLTNIVVEISAGFWDAEDPFSSYVDSINYVTTYQTKQITNVHYVTKTDDFAVQDNAYWTFGTGSTVTGGGILTFAANSAPTVESSTTYDMTVGGEVSIELTGRDDGGSFGSFVGLYLDNDVFGSVAVIINRAGGGGATTARAFQTGGVENVNLTGYSFATHPFVRVRFDTSTVYWEYSADRVSWTTGYSEAKVLNTKTVRPRLSSSSSGATGTWKVDNFALSAATATTNGTSTASAAITVTTGGVPVTEKNISGSSSGSSSTSGSLRRTRRVSGSATGTSTVNAGTSRNRRVSGNATGTSTATGYISKITVKQISGTSTGTSTATGSLSKTSIKSISGSSVGSGSATLSLSRTRRVGGSATGVATTVSFVQRARVVSATSSGLSTAIAVLSEGRSVSGVAQGTSDATASVVRAEAITAASVGHGDATGSLTRVVAISGSASGSSLAVASLGGATFVFGHSNGTSSASLHDVYESGFPLIFGEQQLPGLLRERPVGGQADGHSTTEASVEKTLAIKWLSGSTTGTSSASLHDVCEDAFPLLLDESACSPGLLRERTLAGQADGGSTATVELEKVTDKALSGSSSGTSSAIVHSVCESGFPLIFGDVCTPGLLRERVVSGHSDGDSTADVTIELTEGVTWLGGSSSGTSTTSANIERDRVVSGVSEGSGSIVLVEVDRDRLISGESGGSSNAVALAGYRHFFSGQSNGSSTTHALLRKKSVKLEPKVDVTFVKGTDVVVGRSDNAVVVFSGHDINVTFNVANTATVEFADNDTLVEFP